MGLASELGKLSLPQIIVMGLPVADSIAQKFLGYFLQAYSGGNSLYLSTKKAREQLQGWEKEFPCASWLPVIYQNPALAPPTWSDLRGDSVKPEQFLRQLLGKQNHQIMSLAAAIATILVWSLQSWGWLQSGELKIYDRWMSWRFTQPVAEKVLIVTVDDRDIQYQQQQGMKLQGSLADAALVQLLAKLKPYHPARRSPLILSTIFPFLQI